MTIRTLLAATALATAGVTACATSQPEPMRAADAPELAPQTKAEISALNDLASIFIDAEALYREAAVMPDNDQRVNVSLEALADQRTVELEKLQNRVTTLGGEADQFGEALGTGHRVFTIARTAFSDDTEVAIEEVLRGERYIVDQINKHMTETYTPETKAMLKTIRTQVQADIDSLVNLKKEV